VSTSARGARFHDLQFRLTLAALLVVAALAWAWLYDAQKTMASMRGDGLLLDLMRAMMAPGDSAAYLLASAIMWLVMMIAMMTPAALPMLLVLRGLDRGPAGQLDTAAGIWQLTPFKAACLAHCRGPLGFFLKYGRAGRWGAFVMGLHHGTYCIGCCWMLMVLMFAGGTMSVATMAAVALFVLAERLLPGGQWVTWLPGSALIAIGAVLYTSA